MRHPFVPRTPSALRVMSRASGVTSPENGLISPNTGAITLVSGRAPAYGIFNLLPINTSGSDFITIDAGVSRHTRILSRITPLNRIKATMVTHAHADHVGFLQGHDNETPFLVSEEDMLVTRGALSSEGPLQNRMDHLQHRHLAMVRRPEAGTVTPEEAMVFGNLTVRGVPSPGHTSGSMSYLVTGPNGSDFFVGDALSVGRKREILPPPKILSHDIDQTEATIKDLGTFVTGWIAANGPDLTIRPSHTGPMSGEEFVDALPRFRPELPAEPVA